MSPRRPGSFGNCRATAHAFARHTAITVLNKNVGLYVAAEDLIAPGEATGLATSPRFTPTACAISRAKSIACSWGPFVIRAKSCNFIFIVLI